MADETAFDPKSASMDEIVVAYNAAATKLGEKTIKRFASKDKAIERYRAVQRKLNKAAQPAKAAGGKATNATAKPARAAAKAASGASRATKENDGMGKQRGFFVGKKLYPKFKENPGREGSIVRENLQLIANTPGIAYEAYREAGGRVDKLRWAATHELVEAR